MDPAHRPPEIILEPTLSHCIETLAREEFERLQRALLESGSCDEITATRLETLRAFLVSTDFPQLRREYEPHLGNGRKVRFVIYPEKEGAGFRLEVI